MSPDLEALRERLKAMPAVDVAEELERVWGGMDVKSYDDALLRVYLDILDEKSPMPALPDKAAYEMFLKLIK